jgi:hypothetical protein
VGEKEGGKLELALQCGWGMMRLNRELLSKWGGGTVVLSPRDLTPGQLVSHAGDVNRLGGEVILDPQFYLPHADHERLRSHGYWPTGYETDDFWTGDGVHRLVGHLAALNAELKSSLFLLPGILATNVSDDWLAVQSEIIRASVALGHSSAIFATIALGADAARDEVQIHDILDAAATWECAGYYVVMEHPRGDYLVDDPGWIANCLDLIAGLRLRGAKVMLGYAAHQLLCARLSGATSIVSGTWLNVRSFPPDKFAIPEDEIDLRKSTWFYCHRSLSEYQLTFLDVALEQGLLQEMRPPASYESTWSEKLFQGVRPTTAGFSEPDGFAHYLNALRCQALAPIGGSYREALEQQRRELDDAETMLQTLRAAGVSGKQRDFSRVLDSTRAAIALFDARRGQMMQRRWESIQQ